MGTVRDQGRSLKHPLLGYAGPQGLLQQCTSRSKGQGGWERVSVVSVRQLRVLWGSSAPKRDGHCPTRGLGWEAWPMLMLPPAPSQGN